MGHIAHTTGHRAKRGVAGLVLGVLFLVGGGVAMARARR
jgi:hypothetical protein